LPPVPRRQQPNAAPPPANQEVPAKQVGVVPPIPARVGQPAGGGLPPIPARQGIVPPSIPPRK
jgi:hypothetical protein